MKRDPKLSAPVAVAEGADAAAIVETAAIADTDGDRRLLRS